MRQCEDTAHSLADMSHEALHSARPIVIVLATSHGFSSSSIQFRNLLAAAATLKILHYPVVVCPKVAITMSKSTSEGEILTIKQVADYLKVTERTIYRLAAAKQIPAFKVGGSWRFSRADIDSWIKQQSMEGLETSRGQDGDATGQPNNGERK